MVYTPVGRGVARAAEVGVAARVGVAAGVEVEVGDAFGGDGCA